MPQIQNWDEETKQYFYSLPPYMQENIMQSSIQINSLEDLVKYAQNLSSPQ